jgi:hypothetical protein
MCKKEMVPLFDIEIFNHFLGILSDEKNLKMFIFFEFNVC